MSDVEVRIQGIEEMLKKLVVVVDARVSRGRHRSATSRKRSQSPWKTIRSIIDELVKDIQYVKEMVEGWDFNTGHDRNPGADHRTATPAAILQISDPPPHEKQQLSHNSSNTAEGTQNGGPISADLSAKTNRLAIPAPLLSESDMDENRVRSTTIPDQFPTAPTTVSTTVPTTVERSEVEQNTAVVVTMPRPSRHPVSTISQSAISAKSVSQVPRNPDITIPYREEYGVVVLMPLNKDQCRDTPFLLSQAEALGARETGIFKYIIPEDFDLNRHTVRSVATRVSRFTSRIDPEGVFCISRTEDLETLDISDTSFISTEPDELAEMLEGRLADPAAISKMRYCTDIPAWTAEDRQRLGLPTESPIWPLKNNLLDRTKYKVDGLHRPYGYLSGKDGSLFTIHREDANLISLNALYSGREKPWCAVARKDSYLIENEVKGGKCAQKVRHGSRWFPRSKLKAMGASFVTFVQRPREVVVVWGDIYHQGGTVGPATAEAVNYGGPNWSIEGYSECSCTCPGYPIPNALLELRAPNEPQREQDDEVSQGAHDSVQTQGRERLARDRPPARTRDGKATETELRMNQQETRPPKRRRDVPTPQQSRKMTMIRTTLSSADTMGTETEICNDLVSRMVAAIRSRDVIKQFFDIVQGRRDLEPTALQINFITSPSKRPLRQDPAQMLENDLKIISTLSRKTAFHDFLTRLFQVRLADHVNEINQGRLRSEAAVIAGILKRTGMSKRQYLYHRDRGAKWREYCKAFPGILCFIPFQTQRFGFSSTSWLDLDEGDFVSLRSHLENDYTSALCIAGRAFEQSLDPAADDVDFIWESLDVSLDKISDGELVSILGLFPAKDENIYDPDAYPEWPRPEEWPDDSPWPVDPTSLPPSGGLQCKLCHQSNCPCELCHEKNCCCAAIRHETQPRIRKYKGKYEGKDRGLQAVAREAGQIAYSESDIIAFITGVLAPPDTYHNGQCIQVDRSDILGEPTVAQINCTEFGNISRLVNHSCDPSARFKGMRVSGKFRIAIVAERNVYDGEEITVHYSKKYWGREKCRCPVCRLARPL
ncbi:uncharacterized protein A1O5_12659 [Cladophialophora psammophila CBS 110553]|uniref:SET domain-containing protein n=1 Tax=Cladophialophora psammophila CBS 110553 TaxID=1182543 RepID=W9VL11_9EURO|nr:uncharacterized protein A1O5_12659 [Cladophialophora psammophila CBS 110553]EXJ56203.1 hypothetical protein A1O5_12659 [Cladophialophora psammophila CBS 110553]